MTTPVANPTILFCTLAPTPTLHISLLELIIDGAFAVGGVLLTTVLDTVLVSADEVLIDRYIKITVMNAQKR